MSEWMVERRDRAFQVVRDFEATVSEYTGAPYVVTVDSCTNALFLSLLFERHNRTVQSEFVSLPRRTYVGVAQSAKNAGYRIEWRNERWDGAYWLHPVPICDAAKRFTGGMFHELSALRYGRYGYKMVCVSFQAGKLLPIGRGGAILTDSLEAANWLRRARFDGRSEGGRCDQPDRITTPGYHCYLDPPSAARGLWLMTYLPKDQPDQVDEYEDLSTYECFR